MLVPDSPQGGSMSARARTSRLGNSSPSNASMPASPSKTPGTPSSRRLTNQGTTSEMRPEMIGPRDFAWLLERIADFSSEDGKPKTSDNPQDPPPPMQLHIPETLLFANGRPRALYYTDRGGFVRGARRILNMEMAEVFDAMSRVVKKRRALERQRIEERKQTETSKFISGPPVGNVSQNLMNREVRSGLAIGRLTVVRSPEVAKMIRVDGSVGHLTDPDLISMLEEIRNGSRKIFQDARILQSVFWESGPKHTQNFTTYKYDARKQIADIDYHKEYELHSHTNEFERSMAFKLMDDRSAASAVPVILSTQTSYHCGLELVTGTFEFVCDASGQQWMIDARDMYFVPNSSRRAGGPRAATEPKKVFPVPF